MEINDIRIQNLSALIKEHGSQRALAEKIGIDVSRISQMKTGFRNMGEKTARAIEASLNLPSRWLDTNATAETEAVDQELRELWARLEAAGMADVAKLQIEALLTARDKEK